MQAFVLEYQRHSLYVVRFIAAEIKADRIKRLQPLYYRYIELFPPYDINTRQSVLILFGKNFSIQHHQMEHIDAILKQ